MEMKEAERVAISKPVASRPTCSTFRSFSELLAGAINSSPPRVDTETTIAAIRPKTVRFKPTVFNAPTGTVPLPLQPELCEAPTCQPSDLRSESKSTVVYKPLAKVVSKATVSFLANMGDFNNGNEPAPTSVESPVHCPNEDQNQIRPQFLSNIHQNFSPQTETDQITEPSMMASQNVVEDQKCSLLACNGDRPSYDGYNWRKYGQKQVKGSEYPRSYYKCTHPNCPVKKKVERSFDGQIAEIVYKGEHNHSKPQLAKRNTSGTQGQAFASSDRTGQDSNSQLCAIASHINERNEGSEGRIENQSEQGVSSRSAYPSKTIVCSDPGTNGAALSAGYETKTDNFCGRSGDGDELIKGNDAEDEEPKRKRRKSDNQSIEAGTSGIVLEEPNVVVQSPNETEVITDGFRWRKYGQKVVKGNLYPRSYYRCTSLRCNVRKHVERALDDPRAFITTYEGKHNHEMPIKSTNQVVAEPETHTSTHKDKA